jgi:RHS repeat-associated protein
LNFIDSDDPPLFEKPSQPPKKQHYGRFSEIIEFYTDQEWDAEAGLYNYDARLYDPVIGRFISADSIVPRPFDPQSLNRYSYCRNNPLIYTDPTGHYDDKDNDGDTSNFGHEGTDYGSDDGQDNEGYGREDPGEGFNYFKDPTIQKMVYEDKLRRKNGGLLSPIDRFDTFMHNLYVDLVNPQVHTVRPDDAVSHLADYARAMQTLDTLPDEYEYNEQHGKQAAALGAGVVNIAVGSLHHMLNALDYTYDGIFDTKPAEANTLDAKGNRSK